MKALIIIDMQTALMQDNPWNGQQVVENILRLRDRCRMQGVPVIYIRHDDGPDTALAKGGAGWEIIPQLRPEKGEKVFDKQYNSAFKGTGLQEYLRARGIDTLVLCGMQTEYCVDATCKVAFELGFQMIIPRNTTTTFDCDFATGEALAKYYEEQIWAGRYASVVPVEEVRL